MQTCYKTPNKLLKPKNKPMSKFQVILLRPNFLNNNKFVATDIKNYDVKDIFRQKNSFLLFRAYKNK